MTRIDECASQFLFVEGLYENNQLSERYFYIYVYDITLFLKTRFTNMSNLSDGYGIGLDVVWLCFGFSAFFAGITISDVNVWKA